MRTSRSRWVLRFALFAAVPFLVLVAVLLIQREDPLSRAIGVLAALAALVALLLPLTILRRSETD